MRPSSNSSTRSRRDEVWEMKRQRWLARQRSGDGVGGAHLACPPTHLSDLSALPREAGQAPKSPLSRLVAEGYPPTASQVTSAHHPYGDRPPSDPSMLGMQSGKPSSRGSRASSGGFDARVAGQWSADVQQGVQHRQSRHDPGVVGPPVHCGGQRILQAPGGGASIDLSWAATQHGPPSGGGGPPPHQAHHPPRMPAANPSTPGGLPGQYPGAAGPPYGDAGRQAQRASPTYARGGGGTPWGRDGDPRDAPAPPGRRDACPFGMDAAGPPAAGAAVRSASRGQRHASPSPMSRTPMDAPAAGAAVRGRAAGRPPGGASSFVFG
uniref:Uncharacterized protein n=1 Tax=Alexandrium monilatum TaxID=311494 RepID=A0A7S4QXJ7_9DINO